MENLAFERIGQIKHAPARCFGKLKTDPQKHDQSTERTVRAKLKTPRVVWRYRVFPLGGVVSPAMRDQPLLLQKPWIRPLVAEFGPSEFGRVPQRSVAASVGWSRPSS